MKCQGCGSPMELAHQTVECGKMYRWYVCQKQTCKMELLHISSAEATPAARVTSPSV